MSISPRAALPGPSADKASSDLLKKVCEESLVRGTKRKIKLVPRETWMNEFMGWKELDGDAYSRNGHPPKKLILMKSKNEMEIRSWGKTPCRYGAACAAQKKGYCLFMHKNCQDDVEVAAGSALRLRQIKHAFDTRGSECVGRSR